VMRYQNHTKKTIRAWWPDRQRRRRRRLLPVTIATTAPLATLRHEMSLTAYDNDDVARVTSKCLHAYDASSFSSQKPINNKGPPSQKRCPYQGIL